MAALTITRTLVAHPGAPTATLLLDLASVRHLAAHASIVWVNQRTGDFDDGTAVAADIPVLLLDNASAATATVLSGGVLGPPGSVTNLRAPAVSFVGRGIVCRARVFPQGDPRTVCVASFTVVSDSD